MKSSTTTVIFRSLLGLAFLIFGLNKFLHFIPNPSEPPAAMEFFGALTLITGFYAGSERRGKREASGLMGSS